MKFSKVLLILCALTASINVNALAMGPQEFAAAKSMTCVLARESLGQLNPDDYASSTEAVLGGYNQTEADVIYAKALGYYDGLMFGIPADSQREVSKRLQTFVNSLACTSTVSFGLNT